MTERAAIRFGVPALFLVSTASAVVVSLNTAKSAIPSFAFGSHVVLAVQLTLLFFYAALLLLVPLMRALVDGALPVELSLKGARWAEDLGDLGDRVLERQAAEEEKAQKENFEMQREIATLRRILEEVTDYDERHGDE
jgi:hypothetical protein